MNKGQGFKAGKLARLNVVLYVEEDEKKFLEGLAKAFRQNGRQRSGLAQAIVTLLRVGAACIRDHGTDEALETFPHRISSDEALEAGLTIKRRRSS